MNAPFWNFLPENSLAERVKSVLLQKTLEKDLPDEEKKCIILTFEKLNFQGGIHQ
jgi:hypothetical protein